MIALLFAVVFQDTAHAALPTVRVTATREGPRAPIELPYAVSRVHVDSLAAARRMGVDELLFAIPGVSLSNRQNPAQDPRVSIRGFGARSAFGVRGIRVLQDGVPVTLPDGQTPVDVLDIEGADRVDVVRGSASSLYGNAAGGVIDIRTRPPSSLFTPSSRVVSAERSPFISALGASGTIERVGFTSSLTRIAGSGYRDYSNQQATKAALRTLFGASDGETAPFSAAIRYSDVSHAESPGALTRAQFDANPRQADPQAVLKGTGKIVSETDFSIGSAREYGSVLSVDALAYGGVRTLANPLAFAIVDVKRSTGGASLRFGNLSNGRVRLNAGADAQWQNDDRQEYANCIGITTCGVGVVDRGVLQKNQRELVNSVGPFVRGEVQLARTLSASAGVRSDVINFRLRDRLVSSTNPDDSGERTLHAVSPSAGIVWRARQLLSFYSSISSSFETPTTTELGNKPDGSSGINPGLDPQRTVSIEAGAKGLLASSGVRWDVALFNARASDELIPFDIPNGAGRRYYRNAGRTVRRGAEAGMEYSSEHVSLRSAYAYSHFRYDTYFVGAVSYAGRRIPGVPEQSLMTTAAYRLAGTTLSMTADLETPLDVDDANSAQAPGRAVLGASVGRDFVMSGARLSGMFALQNIGDVHYAGSVSVNATGGKFYEPAPGRALLVRVSLARND